MPIEFRCTKCTKLLRTADQSAGKKAKCPECGQVLRVPSPAPGAPVPQALEPGTAPPPMFDPGAPMPPQARSAPAPGPAPGASDQLGRGRLDMGDVFHCTWEIFKGQMGNCIIVPLVAGLLIGAAMGITGAVVGAVAKQSMAAAALLGLILYLAAIIGTIWVSIGIAGFFLKVARGQPAALGDVFSGDFALILPLFLGGLLLNLIVGIGMLLFVVPGVILALMFSQFQLLVIDRRLGVMDALNTSNDLMKGNKLTLFLILLVAGIAGSLVSLVTFGIGSLFVGPYIALMAVVVYLTVTGQGTVVDR